MPTENPASMKTESAHCIVLTTTAAEALADTLARQIVQARLGGCMQIHALKSVYGWEGALCDEPR